jgi:hypothetical protein
MLAALGAFVFGAEVAHAGVLDPIVEEPAPLAEPAPLVGEAVSDVAATADEVVSDTREAVAETVSQPPAALGNVVAPLEQIVDKTPADELVSDVMRTADPVVRTADPVIARVAETSEARTTAAPHEAPASGTTEPPATQAPTAASAAPFGEAMRQTTTRSARWHGSATRQEAPPVSSNRQYGGTTGGPLPQLVLRGSPEPTAIAASAQNDGSTSVPARPRPFSPLFPAGTSATAALVAGAAGGALTAALLCAFMLLAPRTGRVMWPGRILVRPATCLSLVERPG